MVFENQPVDWDSLDDQNERRVAINGIDLSDNY